MRTITITKNIGFLNELSPELQEKVINKFRSTFEFFEPDFIVSDFIEHMKNIGVTVEEKNIHIESFSGQIYDIIAFMGDMDQYQKYFYSENMFKKFTRWVKFVNDTTAFDIKIRTNRDYTNVYVDADITLLSHCIFVKRGCEEMENHFFSVLNNLLEEKAQKINNELKKRMTEEYTYSQSNENIRDIIMANEYEFDVTNGELIVWSEK